MTKTLIPAGLQAMVAHLESAYPREGCGLIFREASEEFVQVPMDNIYDRYHAIDPVAFPRDARTAYKLDELRVSRLLEDADRRGARLTCIVHSHCDVGAYFSEEDRKVAAPDGEPLWPDVAYLVVAVDQGRATLARAYVWQAGDFVESPVALP